MDKEEEEYALLVTGSRSIKNRAFVFEALDKYPRTVTLLIHGGAAGVDSLAGEWARARNIPVRIVRPDFTKWPVATYRWKAYTQRDREMVDMADTVVAIWDGKSSGTRLTFEYADTQQKLHTIVNTKEQSGTLVSFLQKKSKETTIS